MLSVTEKSDTVSKCRGSAAVDSGAEYYSSMTSNDYLFDKALLDDKLIELK